MTFCVFAGQEEDAAWAYLKDKNYFQALELFSALSLDDPGSINLKIGIARATQGLGKLTEAEVLFRQLRQHKNWLRHWKPLTGFCGNHQIELGLATCLDMTGDAEKRTEAEGVFRQLRQQENRRRKHKPVEGFCDHHQIELGLARCLEGAGDVEKLTEAEEVLRQLRQQENWQRHQLPLDGFCGNHQIELGLATCLDMTGDAEKRTEAEEVFWQLRQQENLQHQKWPVDGFCGHHQIELGLARCLQHAGKLTEAEEVFRQLRQQANKRRHQAPVDGFCGELQIELGLATCLDLIGDVEKRTEAEGVFRQLRQQENQRKHQPPNDFCGHLQIELGLLACLNKQIGKSSETDQLATTLIEALPTIPASHHWQLFHVIATVRFTLACKEIINGSAPAKNQNLQSAMTMVKCLCQERETPQSLSLQGHVLRMMGYGEQAKELWKRANTLQPSRQQVPKREAWRQLEQAALDKRSSPDTLSAATGQPLQQQSCPRPCPQPVYRPGLNPNAQPFEPGKTWSQ